ncbi:hypothetical protein DY000_02050349 [Brassica cretica]|uniref:Uncharacterized protein n=1 Tax=Brassica cretica TaxID=69181 RepID=A0ABQ7F4P8_BRACR|nr:hypothetical protein DY000_02050349 [Brassica cretica]
MERKDWWFLLLKQELTSHRIALNPRFIISVFCRTPLHIPFPPLVLQHKPGLLQRPVFENRSRDALYCSLRSFLKILEDSRYRITDELMSVLINSRGRGVSEAVCGDEGKRVESRRLCAQCGYSEFLSG